jgi:CheY-like chemotaxis protein
VTVNLRSTPARALGTSILLVDDDAAIRDITAIALQTLGYSVEVCSSAVAALDLVRGAGRFDLLITDVVMAPVNGIELASRIRENRPNMKVLFCSGHPREGLARQGLHLGTDEFLMKPISIGRLSAMLEKLLPATASA